MHQTDGNNSSHPAQIIVSFEGLPGVLRDVVARRVCGSPPPAAQPPAAAASENDAFATRVLHMLEQLRAVAECRSRVVYATASWLDKVPTAATPTDSPTQVALYSALLASACDRLGIPRDGQHHAVCLHVDVDETFEGLMELGADARNVGIEDLLALDRRIRNEEITHTVCPVTYHHVHVNRYAADCAEDVERVVAEATRLVEGVLHG